MSAGLMQPPGGCAQTGLMRMNRSRDGRGWMEPDPELPWPEPREWLPVLLWVAALILFVGWVHRQTGR